jgi:hypothetical protein
MMLEELAMATSGVPIQPKDRRGYFMLSQAPEEAGYYVYENLHTVPETCDLAQYVHPDLLSVIFYIECEWQAICDRKFGIGNISVDGGFPYDDHATQQTSMRAASCTPG